jgi:hypothetical protein
MGSFPVRVIVVGKRCALADNSPSLVIASQAAALKLVPVMHSTSPSIMIEIGKATTSGFSHLCRRKHQQQKEAALTRSERAAAPSSFN